MGYPAYYSPLPSERGRGRGCIGCVSGFCQGRAQAFEIPLQTVRCYCSQINLLSLKIAFVTIKESIGYKEACKRCPFALQNMPFYTSKDALLHIKRRPFTLQKGIDGKVKGKDVDKNTPRNTASPSPSKGGDVPGGIRNAVSWGGGRMEDLDLKGVCLFLMVKCLEVKNRLCRTQTDYLLIRQFVVLSMQLIYFST